MFKNLSPFGFIYLRCMHVGAGLRELWWARPLVLLFSGRASVASVPVVMSQSLAYSLVSTKECWGSRCVPLHQLLQGATESTQVTNVQNKQQFKIKMKTRAEDMAQQIKPLLFLQRTQALVRRTHMAIHNHL